jgi:1-acyl-sn-glycerol-3-phosphate acyltransferase
MKRLKSLAFMVWLYGSMAVIGVTLAPFAVFNRRAVLVALRVWAKATLFGLRWIIGARVRFEGLEHAPRGPALVASKHQSMLDTLVPGMLLKDAAIVYKEELQREIIFGWFIQRGEMVPVARDEGATALKRLLRAAKKAIADGRQIFIFPEGTRTSIGAAPDYKPGVAAIYMALRLPCTPVALNTGLIWPARGIDRSPGEAIIRFLPAIPAGLSREDFMRELETRIEQESQALLPADLRRAAS